VDHLGDEHGLVDPGAAEESGLAAALERAQQVDHLDAGLEDLRADRPPRQRHGRPVNRLPLDVLQWRAVVDDLPEDVQHPSEQRCADRDLEGPAGVGHHRPASEAARRRERDAAHGAGVHVVRHLQHDCAGLCRDQLLPQRRQRRVEADVHDVALEGHHHAPSGFVHTVP
jgi:hypothetical protein